jgi:hypothetical protein
MKKNFTVIEFLVRMAIVAIVVSLLLPLFGCDERSAKSEEFRQQRRVIETAQANIPIPQVSYYQERRTIAKWAQRWDKPNIPCYVYLVSYGTIIGYYVTDGKPACTRNYILPEYKHNDHGSWGCCLEPTADLDGTYGDNNPGIRFFTAEGTAVEWGGQGATYIYSDAPLPLNIPKLNRTK